MTTVRLVVSLDATQSNVYALAGTPEDPMTFPAAYQCATPFGTQIGGANPAFFAIANNAAIGFAEFDSWLTIGITDGTLIGAIAASPGLDLAGMWTETAAFSTTNGAIFWMDPTAGPSGAAGPVVMAQVTSPTGVAATAGGKLQGKSTGGGQDWDLDATWSW